MASITVLKINFGGLAFIINDTHVRCQFHRVHDAGVRGVYGEAFSARGLRALACCCSGMVCMFVMTARSWRRALLKVMMSCFVWGSGQHTPPLLPPGYFETLAALKFMPNVIHYSLVLLVFPHHLALPQAIQPPHLLCAKGWLSAELPGIYIYIIWCTLA